MSEPATVPTACILGTGGTIASRVLNEEEGAVAAISPDSLLLLVNADGVACKAREVLRKGSYRFDEGDVRTVARAALEAAAEPDCDGVVVVHGTDTMEEVAFLVDLFHGGSSPIVFCGAQRSADAPDTDGPRNLEEAIRLAVDPNLAGIGVAICLGGTAWPARYATKQHTSALTPFAASDAGPVATVEGTQVRVGGMPWRPVTLAPRLLDLPLPRVELVTACAGVDGALVRAAVVAGARGIVVAAFGIGNVTDDFAAAIGEAIDAGVPVVISSRCAGGPVAPVYGGEGGGVELARRGAVFGGRLRPSHARLLLAVALLAGVEPARLDEYLAPFV